MAYLINGNGFEPVTAQQDADLYGGIVGLRPQVLNIGQRMAASLIDSNTVRIGDGEALAQGRRIHNDPGMYDDFIIPNGSQGTTHWYIIGYLLHTDSSTGQEVADTFVQQMTSATATIPEEVLRDGAAEAYISFYRITQEGVSLTGVEALYDRTYSIEEMLELVYPVGSIYMSVNNVNPGTWMQHTTWVRWAAGRVPVGVNPADGNLSEAENIGGYKSEISAQAAYSGPDYVNSNDVARFKQLIGGRGVGMFYANRIEYAGGQGLTISNMQPYITCHMWKRTA